MGRRFSVCGVPIDQLVLWTLFNYVSFQTFNPLSAIARTVESILIGNSEYSCLDRFDNIDETIGQCLRRMILDCFFDYYWQDGVSQRNMDTRIILNSSSLPFLKGHGFSKISLLNLIISWFQFCFCCFFIYLKFLFIRFTIANDGQLLA